MNLYVCADKGFVCSKAPLLSVLLLLLSQLSFGEGFDSNRDLSGC